MDGDDAARFDPPAAARQKEDIHPAVLRFGERLLDAGYRENRSRTWRAAIAASPTLGALEQRQSEGRLPPSIIIVSERRRCRPLGFRQGNTFLALKLDDSEAGTSL
jgi:hypothetical protein